MFTNNKTTLIDIDKKLDNIESKLESIRTDIDMITCTVVFSSFLIFSFFGIIIITKCYQDIVSLF